MSFGILPGIMCFFAGFTGWSGFFDPPLFLGEAFFAIGVSYPKC
jgi:hypothetical protein